MALAIRFGALIRSGEVTSYAELAVLGRVTPARMTRVLLCLAPDIQEEPPCSVPPAPLAFSDSGH
jgi:hypothetical protein